MREAINGIKHPAFRDALALTRAGGRTTVGRYLAEDADLVRQALASPKTEVAAVFAAPDEAARLEVACAARSVPLYILGGGLLTKLIGTSYETASSAVAVIVQRPVAPAALLRFPDPLILCGERIQDPRNVGVLIRTAEAAGCAGLLLSRDSAEPYSRQAVRSTTGSILRVPISLTDDLSAALRELRDAGARIAASSGQAPTLAYDVDLSARPLVVVVGNEQSGVSDAVQAVATDYVRLPMPAVGADSLNVTVAAGALIYESVRQRLSVSR
jgi:TrmH family RNA methyltransferase